MYGTQACTLKKGYSHRAGMGESHRPPCDSSGEFTLPVPQPLPVLGGRHGDTARFPPSAAVRAVHVVHAGAGTAARLIKTSPGHTIVACRGAGITPRERRSRITPVAALGSTAHPHDVIPRGAGYHGTTSCITLHLVGQSRLAPGIIILRPIITHQSPHAEGTTGRLKIHENGLFVPAGP